MDAIDKTRKIKAEADLRLKRDGIEALMQSWGDVIYTGSYALDLMVWPDIDLYVVPKAGLSFEECAAGMSADFLRRQDVDVVKVSKSMCKVRPELPQGVCMGVKIPTPNHILPWKLDIWIVEEDVRKQNRELMNHITSRLTATRRELIIRAKTALICNGRTPSMSGVLVYNAVLDMGLSSVDEVVDYVSSHQQLER